MMSSEKPLALGIDLGGTKTLAAVIDVSSGEVVASARKRTRAERGQDFVAHRIIELSEAALKAANMSTSHLLGIGIGAAGQVDREVGVVLNAPNLGGRNLSLREILGTRFDVPVFVGNDVEVAARGEYLYGSGRCYQNFVCVFVGTGIGSGIVANGQIYTGLTGTAGEIGHIVVQANGRICGCGARGCLEAYASRTAMTKAILAEIYRGRSSVLASQGFSSVKVIRSGLLANAIQRNDELVMEVVKQAAEFLGYGLSSVLNFYNPEAIILGGGVVEAIDLLFDTAVHRARVTALPGPGRSTPIIRARLGDFSGAVGAACLGAQLAGYTFS
jgi:glucokinase